MLLTSDNPDLVKKSASYQAQFPLKTYDPKSDVDQTKKLDAITQATRKFALLMRKEAENNVANELVARLTEKTYKSWNIKFRVSRAAFRYDILSYITETNDYEHVDLTYNYFDKYRNNNFDLTSFNNNWTNSTDTPESRAIKSELDRVYSAQEQSDVAQRAIDAYITLILKGYTNEEAVALLSTNRLSNWGATARRLPIAQKEQVVAKNNLTNSGSSLGNLIKKLFKKENKSPAESKSSPEKLIEPVTEKAKPVSDSAIEIKDTDSQLVKDVKNVAQTENLKLFEIPSSQLSDRIDLDEDGEAKGSRSNVSKTKIVINGVEKEVAVKIYLSETYPPQEILRILALETTNGKLAKSIFGDQASELVGVVITDDGKVGLITELIEIADDNFIPTEKTASDLMSIQQKMLKSGYYIKDFAINYLIQKDGSVKLIDFEQLVKISSLIDDKINLKTVAKDNKVTQSQVKSDPTKYILLSSLRNAVMSANIIAQNITYKNGLTLPSNSIGKMYDLPNDINFLDEISFFTDISTRPSQQIDNYVVLNEYIDATFKAEPNAKSVTIGYIDSQSNYKTHTLTRPKLSQLEVEQKYISDKLEKFPLLDERYADESTSFDGYTADMNKYIGKSNVKAAPKGNISKDGLDKVKSNVQAEITRLLKNKKYRNNQEKYDIVTWQTNRFVDLLKQAIDEGDIKTDGDNVLTLQAAQDLILRNIHTLAYQDFVASENTLGDHGVRHLVDHNIRVGEKVLDLAKTKDTHTNKSEAIRAIDYLILHQVMIDHDTGYAMNVVRTAVNLDATKGYDSGHNVLAAKMIRERTESGTDPLSQLFGKDGVARIHQGVINHDSSAVDITVDRATSVDSAIHLADNTHAFETKLPELLYGYPDSIVAMRLLKAAGEIGDEKLMQEIKLQLINNIQNNSNIGIDDKIALTNAVRTLTKNSYSYTVGRIMGHNPQITFDDTTGKIIISVTESEIHQQVVGLFNRDAYDQLAKFIADLLGIKKAEAIARIQNNDLKFDGKNVVIQANVIDQNNPTRIVTKNTDFQDRVRDLTANNPAFVEYLSKDDNLKDLAKSKEEEIQAKSTQGLEKPFLDELQRQLDELKQARSDAAQAYLISQNNIDLNKAPTLMDRLKDLFKKAPKIEVIPVAHDTKQLAINESAYLNRFAPKMKNLQVRYDHVNSSELGYTSSMNRYIGAYKIKSPGSAPLTTKGLEKVRSNVKSEITRLFNNKNRRQNPLKFREVSWEVNRYLDLIAQAIKDGDIKTDGSNGLTLEDIQSIVVRNIHTLAYQDFVAAENTLGDHGVRHLILHNIHVGEKVLDLSVENKTNADPVRAIDYLMLHQVMIDHDMGYAVDIVRMGVNRDSTLGADSGHNVLAAKILRERTESGLDPLSRFFGTEGIARIHEGILYHDRHTVDLSQSRAITLDSAIHLADNTHAFESKLPELLYGYPDSIIAMRLLKAAGELNNPQLMEEIKQKLIDDIQKNKNLAPDDKISLIKAVGTLTPKSYAFTAGRIMGNDPQLTYENGKVVVSVTESDIHQDVVSLFDQQSYAQLAKFLEDILKTNNKAVFLEQINGNTKRFEGDTVIVQALIGKDLKDKTKGVFQEKLADLTGNNPNFTDYLNQDDNQKDLMNALITKIQAKKNPPKSIPKILKTRDFKTLIITLKSGEVRVFTDVMGTLTFARYEDGESTPTDYDYINAKDLSKYLPENDEIQAVRRDGEELPQGSYTVKETEIDQAEINELESNLADMRTARATLIREYLNPGSSKSEPELKTINDDSSIKLKKVEINGKFILVPEVESIQNMVQFIDKIIGANYENGQRLAGCRKNLCVAAAQIATVVSKASTNWSAEVYEIRDLNTFRNIGERDTFSGHAVVIMTEKNTSEKYIVDLTFSQFINPENNTISFHNLYGENSSNIPFLQKAIDMRIANGEKVNINTGIDYTKNNTATQLFEHGYLPFSEISNYLNLTVEQSSVNSAEDHRDKGFWARNISSLEPDSIYIDEENNAIDQVNKYTESLPEQTSSNQKLIQPISHKILNDTLEVIKTDEGYIVKPTGKSPVKTLETSWFGQPEPIHEDGLSLNDTFTSLKVIVDGQIYDMSFEDGIATITNSVSGQSTLLTDHVTKGKSWFMKLGNSFENFGLKLGSIFNPNYLIQMNLDMMIYGAQTDTYIGTSPLDVKDIPKAILRERIKNVGESDLHLATRKYVADYMFHTDDPDVLALDEVIRTADLLYNYLELDTYLGPLVQTNEEQLIGSPVINWSLTDNHTINLSNVHTDDNISLVDHLKSGHIITIEEPTRTTTISWDGNNYVIKRDFKNGSPIKENKTGNIARVESDYLPRAEDFNTKTYQIYIVNAGGANLHSSPLFDLLVASTPTMTFTDYRTPWQQFLDRFFGRTIGIVNFSIFGLKQPLPNQSFILFPEESVEINPDSNPDAKTSIETFTIDAKKSEIKDGFNLKRSQLAIIFNDVGSLFTSEGPISGTHINAYETSMIIERMLADLGLSEQTDSIYELDTNHIIGKEITLQFERYGKYYRTKVDYPERVEDEKIVNAYYAQSNHGDKRWHIGNVGYSSDGEVRSSGFTKTFDIGYGAKIKIGAAVVQNRDGKIITTNQVISVIPPKELNTNIASLTVYSKTVDGKEKVDIEVVPRDWSKPYPTFKEVSPSDVKDFAMLEIKKNLALTPFYPKNGIATGLREVVSSTGTVYSLKNEIGVSKDYTLYLSTLPDGKKVIVKIANNNQKSFDTTIGENSYLTTLAKVLKDNKLDTRGSVESYGLVLDKSGQPVGYAMEYLPTVAPQVLTASDIQTVKPTLDLFAGIGKRIDGPIGVITRADGTPAFAPLPGNRIIDVRPGLYIPGLQSGGIQ